MVKRRTRKKRGTTTADHVTITVLHAILVCLKKMIEDMHFPLSIEPFFILFPYPRYPFPLFFVKEKIVTQMVA
jgi:hypothetical protein